MPFSWVGQRVLLTGGSGFLGQNMTQLLKGVNSNRGIEKFTAAPHLGGTDLRSSYETAALFGTVQPTVVIHMAGLVGGIQANLTRPADFFYDNVVMGANVLRCAQEFGLKKAVAVAAGCGYPERAPVPTRETDYWDGYPQAPSAAYSLAKRMLIVQAEALYRQHGFVTVVGIPGNIYGPYDNFHLTEGHVVPALVRKFVDAAQTGAAKVVAWGSGKATRDFVYAEDVCDGLLRAAEVYESPQLVNLSSGIETTIAEVVDHLVTLTGFKGRVEWDRSMPDGQSRRFFDVTKAQRDLGFTAKTSLEDGLAKTVEWYQKNQEKARK
jgi:GDP-L-fucose synthase